MYEPVPMQQIVENVMHIYGLYRNAATGPVDAEERSARMLFLRSLINNLQHEKSKPSPRVLHELSQRIHLSIGGSFKLLGYRLDSMREVDFLLNGHRTRIIESYPFFRDREIDLPCALSAATAFERSALVSELITNWQRSLPIRALQGDDWQRRGMYYVQIGTEDSPALAGIPPGAVVSIEPVSLAEQSNPDPDGIYCLQFGNGYKCCRCLASQNKLILIPRSSHYVGQHEFLYPQEVRIVGRARGFAAQLPLVLSDKTEEAEVSRSAPLILPWEQPSLATLLQTERLRFGLKEQMLDQANQILESRVGATLSRRTLRRYAYEARLVPHTDTLLALTLFHSVRISDVLRSLRFWQDESRLYSLASLLKTRSLVELPVHHGAAAAPEPRMRWRELLNDWGEWPTLLSLAIPQMEQYQHRLLRIYRNPIFDGLDPLLRVGSVALLEELHQIPKTQDDREKRGWNRPMYAIRRGEEVFCGYCENDGMRITLIPHPRSSARRVSFLHHQITILGKLAGIASPL